MEYVAKVRSMNMFEFAYPAPEPGEPFFCGKALLPYELLSKVRLRLPMS